MLIAASSGLLDHYLPESKDLRQNKLTNFWLLTSEPHAEIAQVILTQVLKGSTIVFIK